MADRIAEIRKALQDGYHPGSVVARAARAYADLLDSDALIIRRDENGEWPEAVVTRIAFALAGVQLRRGIVPGDKQGAVSLLDALASSQGVEP